MRGRRAHQFIAGTAKAKAELELKGESRDKGTAENQC